MPLFHANGLQLNYLDEGTGEPILLIHGFASNGFINWVYPGWVDLLVKSGRRVIAIDNRGHGESEKLYDQPSYALANMAGDAVSLLDHLGLEAVDVMGYSMGARISALIALTSPDRVKRLILGGLGYAIITGMTNAEVIASALEAASLSEIKDPTGRAFRAFADQTRSDRRALAACIRANRRQFSAEEMARIRQPTLIAVGTRDDVAGSAAGLAAIMPRAEVLDIPDRNHMVAVGDKVFKAGVVAFLDSAT